MKYFSISRRNEKIKLNGRSEKFHEFKDSEPMGKIVPIGER